MFRFWRESTKDRGATGRWRSPVALTLAAATLTPVVAPWGTTGAAAPVGQGFHVNASDLRFILQQIEIAEHHVANTTLETGPCGALVGPGDNQIPEGGVGITLPWGLRTVDGTCNNIAMPDQAKFGTADQPFPRIAPAEVRPGYGTSGNVVDPDPRMVSNIIVDQSTNNPAAVAAAAAAGGVPDGTTDGGADNLFIPNVAPDTGLSAPYNSWFTLFGQFFDHGLDLVTKGNAGTVMITLPQGDPLADAAQIDAMFLTRATNVGGEATNQTSSWIDQSQTYASHPSHQVFLREYVLGVDGKPVATGRLIEGPGGGMGTWDPIKAQARNILGIELTDTDVFNVPLVLTDPYGNFIPGVNGFPQLVLDNELLREGVLPQGAVTTGVSTVGTAKTGHAFLDDIAHHATPGTWNHDNNPATPRVPQTPDTDPGTTDDGLPGTYDDEMLGAHFIAGDGRVNENIGLTAVHHVFHSEHNRLAEEIDEKITLLLDGVTAADRTAWLNVGPDTFSYNERLFQAARFVTEMQYQHLAFEEFARYVQPMVNLFGEGGTGYHTDIDPRITAEFAHAVYRFGHSMLNETLDRTTATGAQDNMLLLDAFLNPPSYFDNTTDAKAAAGEIVMGMTRQVGNELDEFVTEALRNDLVGLPLDLAALNIARGRETGIPTLNNFRRYIYDLTGDSGLAPYANWLDFGLALRHGEESLINFIAAYGRHPDVLAQSTPSTKRTAARTLLERAAADLPGAPVAPVAPVDPVDVADPGPAPTVVAEPLPGATQEEIDAYNTYLADKAAWDLADAAYQAFLLAQAEYDTVLLPQYNTAVTVFEAELAAHGIQMQQRQDAIDFLNATGPWATNETGLNLIDLWMGGLAERQQVFGGLLGSTFNYVFERQMESLQDGDRFYYLSRTAGLNLLVQLEGNSFSELIMRNTTAVALPALVFTTPAFVFDLTKQNPTGPIVDDPATPYPENGPAMLVREANGTIRYTGVEHVSFWGTNGTDKARASEGDDTFRGNEGNDVYEGGDGNDHIIGGEGDDILTDLFGDEMIKGGPGNDTISSGRGFAGDLAFGGEGNDFIIGGNDAVESFGGGGDDYIYAGDDLDTVFGDEGDDWMEGGRGPFALLQGDSGAPFQDDPNEPGNDVLFGWGGEQDYDAEGGDDIMFAGPGIQRAEGMLGFDWVTHRGDPVAGNSDMALTALLPPAVDVNRDRFDMVEALSGWNLNDVLRGNDDNADTMIGHELNAAGIARIAGLSAIVGADGFTGGNIILGGAGSDIIEGRGGNDVIDGDRWLDAQLRAPDLSTAAPLDTKLVDNLPALRADVLAGRINPGQLSIVRAIKGADDGKVDTALFSDVIDNYTIDADPTTGIIVVSHLDGLGADGIDTLHNIERIEFANGAQVLRGQLINAQATGTVSFTGDLVEGATLTATSAITDTDGPIGPITYNWQIEVPDFPVGTTWATVAVGPELILDQLHVGSRIRVVATFDDFFGVTEQVDGIPSLGTVQNVNDPLVGTITLSTLAPVSLEPMSVLADITDEDGATTPLVEWLVDGTVVATGSAFTPGDEHVNLTVQVRVTHTDVFGDTEVLLSEVTGPITVPPRPTATISGLAPLAFGTRAVGTTALLQSVTLGNTGAADLQTGAVVTGPDAGSFTVSGDCAVVPVGTTCPYTVTQSTAGPAGARSATLVITTNDPAAPTMTIELEGTVVANSAPTGTPVIDDLTPLEGQPLAATTAAIADADGLGALAFEWQQSAPGGGGAFTAVPGATDATFTPGDGQVNRQLQVVVRYIDGHGTTEAVTSGTTVVVGDLFIGTGAAENWTGTGGDDDANGAGGADNLAGGTGDDLIRGGSGDDAVNGGAGADVFRVGLGDGFDTVTGGTGNDRIDASAPGTVIGLRSLTGIEVITSGGFSGVVISGTTGAEVLNFAAVLLSGIASINGGGGNDNITGSAAADVINGAAGDDIVNGGGGNDTITGGAGLDRITPGAGNDLVVSSPADGTNRVLGFDANAAGGQDRIDIRSFPGITAANFATQVVRVNAGGGTRITFTGFPTVVIRLDGVNAAAVTAADFLVD
ncbi:MAG: peroxidase family protein [Ilumatobacteraceae bacterium]